VQKYALTNSLEVVQLVAGDTPFLVDFYAGLGFKVIKKLPNFLPGHYGILMEYRIN
jgi:hypothetical protein